MILCAVPGGRQAHTTGAGSYNGNQLTSEARRGRETPFPPVVSRSSR